jgi:hypothetical protein
MHLYHPRYEIFEAYRRLLSAVVGTRYMEIRVPPVEPHVESGEADQPVHHGGDFC